MEDKKIKIIQAYEYNGEFRLGTPIEQIKEMIINGDFVYAYNLRGIGKTTLLNEIAKKKGWGVLNRKTKNGVQRGTSYKLLIDEDVDYNELPNFIKERIVGGFTQYTDINQLKLVNTQKECKSSNSYKELDILSSLKQNAKVLTMKIEESIRKENDGTTKNLINSLGLLLTIIEKYDKDFTLNETERNPISFR